MAAEPQRPADHLIAVDLPRYRDSVVAALEAFTPPTNLNGARDAVLMLSGVDKYLSDPSIIQPDKRAELSGGTAVMVDRELDTMTDHFLEQTQAVAEITWIAYGAGWSEQQTRDFLADPHHQPFQSYLENPRTPEELTRQYLTIGNYLRMRYDQAREEAQGTEPTSESQAAFDKAKQNLARFHEHSVYPLFSPMSSNLDDRIWGIDPDNRRKGIHEPSEHAKALIAEVSQEVADRRGIDAVTVEVQVLGATAGGELQLIRNFLEFYTGTPETREALEVLFERIVGNREHAVEKIQLTALIDMYRRKAGVTLRDYYDINGYEFEGLEERVFTFLKNPEIAAEVRRHLETETPDTVAQAELTGQPLQYNDLTRERTQRRNLPAALPTVEENPDRIKRLRAAWRGVFPLSGFETPMSMVIIPEQIGAQRRAFNCFYRTGTPEASSPLNVSILNPWEGSERFVRVDAHEGTHALHNTETVMSEEKGDVGVKTGAAQNMSRGVKEMFAQLVDKQATKWWSRVGAKSGTEVKTASGGKYPDLHNALLHLVQAPYALTQLRTRQLIDQIWAESGIHQLSTDEAAQVFDQMRPYIDQSFQPIGGIQFSRANLIYNLSPLAGDDGIGYIYEDIKGDGAETDEVAPVKPSLEKTFSDRFGDDWLTGSNSHEAQLVLGAVLVETGRYPDGTDEDLQRYVDVVRTMEPDEARELLLHIGVPASYLS